jgi:hypothetical protein
LILFFTSPTEGYIRHEIMSFKDSAAALMRARGDTLIWSPVTDCSTMACRNRGIEDMLKTPAGLYLSMDSDCKPFRDGAPDMLGLGYMLEALKRDDVDIVFGWSLILREAMGDLVPCVLRPKGSDKSQPERWPVDLVTPYLSEPLTEIKGGAVGSHCFMAKRRVFEGMRSAGRLYFDDVHERDPESPKYGGRIQGHDVSFCCLAQDLGYRVWVDNRVFWGHMKTVDLKWVHDIVLGLSQRIAAHESVALEADPGTPAWMTLRRAEERARGHAVCMYRDGQGFPRNIGESHEGDAEVIVYLFEKSDGDAFKAFMDSLPPERLPVQAESVGGGVVVTL